MIAICVVQGSAVLEISGDDSCHAEFMWIPPPLLWPEHDRTSAKPFIRMRIDVDLLKAPPVFLDTD